MAPLRCNKSKGAVRVAREASTTALYSGAFLSGLNKILYNCSRTGWGQMPSANSCAHCAISATMAFFFSIATSACAITSAEALRK